MPEPIVIVEEKKIEVITSQTLQGPPGPKGDPGPPGDSGEGYMRTLIYDPRGFSDDVFDIGNMTGIFDAGTF
jgi:hypothetical protein